MFANRILIVRTPTGEAPKHVRDDANDACGVAAFPRLLGFMKPTSALVQGMPTPIGMPRATARTAQCAYQLTRLS